MKIPPKSDMKIPPKSVRLSVYKKALKVIEENLDENNHPFGLVDFCLCLLLPSILCKLDSYLRIFSYEGQLFYYCDTPKMFPEFSEYYPSSDYIRENSYRIKILKEIIKKMEQDKLKIS